MLMTGFEPRISGVRSDRSTTAPLPLLSSRILPQTSVLQMHSSTILIKCQLILRDGNKEKRDCEDLPN